MKQSHIDTEDIVNEICSFAIKRYRNEKPNINSTKEMMDAIWFSVYGELQRNGEEAAWEYAKTAELIDESMTNG